MRNQRMDVNDFLDMQMKHYERVWDMGVRNLSFPPYPIEFVTWHGKRVVFCDFSSDVILFGGCEYCRNDSIHCLDKNNCCVTCSAPVEM